MRSSGKSLSWPNKLGQNIFTDWSSWSPKDLHMEYMVLTQTKMSWRTKLEAQLSKKTIDDHKNNVFSRSRLGNNSLILTAYAKGHLEFSRAIRSVGPSDFSCIWTFSNISVITRLFLKLFEEQAESDSRREVK